MHGLKTITGDSNTRSAQNQNKNVHVYYLIDFSDEYFN